MSSEDPIPLSNCRVSNTDTLYTFCMIRVTYHLPLLLFPSLPFDFSCWVIFSRPATPSENAFHSAENSSQTTSVFGTNNSPFGTTGATLRLKVENYNAMGVDCGY